jgi:hypothetical protein
MSAGGTRTSKASRRARRVPAALGPPTGADRGPRPARPLETTMVVWGEFGRSPADEQPRGATTGASSAQLVAAASGRPGRRRESDDKGGYRR